MSDKIKYVIGDATRPEGEGNRIIAHVCNDYGGWGKGFVLALSARDAVPEIEYREWVAGLGPVPFGLGKVQIAPYIETDPGLYVANMVARRGEVKPGDIPLSYVYLAVCLNKLQVIVDSMRPRASVHMPRIGCGLAGGEWSKVRILVRHFLTNRGVPVTVYDLL